MSISLARQFCFTEASRFSAITQSSEQIARIDRYQQDRKIPVYYHLYNPWQVPYELDVPLTAYDPPAGKPDLGVRVVPASVVHPIVERRTALTALAAPRCLAEV